MFFFYFVSSYSLGNFLSAQLNDQNYNKMVGLMSSLTINKTKNKSINGNTLWTFSQGTKNALSIAVWILFLLHFFATSRKKSGYKRHSPPENVTPPPDAVK